MEKYCYILISFFCFTYLNAHTCEKEKVKCPIDGKTVEFCVTMSMTTFGSFKDFQEQGAIGNHYEQLINSCPKCHFSGFIDDFKTKLTADQKKKVSEFLIKFENSKIDNAFECKIAGELNELLSKENSTISYCYRIGSYLLRNNEKQTGFRKELQLQTKLYLIKALENKEFEDLTILGNINYLIAEMSRRIGNFEEAIKYYDTVINDPQKKDWVGELAKVQKELAIKSDDNNKI